MSEKKEGRQNIVKEQLTRIWGNINDFKDPEIKRKARTVLKGDILNKNIIADNTGLFLLLMLLAFIYVGIRYYVEDDIKQISKLQKELKDVRIESITRSSELMEISKRSTVVKTVRNRGLGLTESTQPPLLIK